MDLVHDSRLPLKHYWPQIVGEREKEEGKQPKDMETMSCERICTLNKNPPMPEFTRIPCCSGRDP